MILSQMKSCRSLRRQVLDVLVDDLELGHRGHVEAGPRLVERPHDGRIGIGLHGVVGLHARQVLLELGVVRARISVVIDHEQRRAVLGDASCFDFGRLDIIVNPRPSPGNS